MAEDQASERTKRPDIDSLSFEQALSELEGIVRRLEQGSARLEEAIVAYQRGEALRHRCEKLLAQAQGEVEKITRVPDSDKKNNDKSDKAQGEPTFSRQKLQNT